MIIKKERKFNVYYVKLYNGKTIGPLSCYEANQIDARFGEGKRNNFGDREPKIGDIVMTDVACFLAPDAWLRNGAKVEIIDTDFGLAGDFYIVKGVENGDVFKIRDFDIQWWYN